MNFVIILQFICTNPQVLIRKAWLLIVFDEEIIEENKSFYRGLSFVEFLAFLSLHIGWPEGACDYELTTKK